MTKKQYLDRLQRYLCFRLSEEEISDILCDMEECFEAGAAEGKSEETIISGLGEPKAAADALISERTKSVSIFSIKITKHLFPLLICGIICWLYFFGESQTGALGWLVYIIPAIMWFSLERKHFFKTMTVYKSDWCTFSAAVLILAAAVLFRKFPTVLLVLENSADILTLTIALLIISAMTLWIISIKQSGIKLLWLIPSTVILYTVYRTSIILSFISKAPKLYDDLFYSWAGPYIHSFITLIFVCTVLITVWSFLNKNSLTLPSLYITVVLSGFVFEAYRYLTAFDPYNTQISASFNNRYISGAAICGAVSLAVVIGVRLLHKKKDGER